MNADDSGTPADLELSIFYSKDDRANPNAGPHDTYVQGNLAAVDGYAVDTVDSLALTTTLTNTSVPVSGSGFHFLIRPDCLVGSWQTAIGAEPGRDTVLP